MKRIASEIEGKIPLVLFNPRLVRSVRWLKANIGWKALTSHFTGQGSALLCWSCI